MKKGFIPLEPNKIQSRKSPKTIKAIRQKIKK
jgi:hypothetical protein